MRFLVLLFLFGALPIAAEESRPNILVVLLDDLGFSDMGFLGSEIRTPAIDQLAATGLTVTNFYVHPRCSPTRASLLTGQYPHSVGMGFLTTPHHVEPKPGPYQGYLDHNATTLAEVLREKGYRTYLSGKWHLGEHERNWPRQHGFDRYFGLISGASSYYELILDQPMHRQMAMDDENWDPPASGFYMTEAFTDQALRYLEEHQRSYSDEPFLLYLAYTAPHWPLHAPPDAIEEYEGVYDDGPGKTFRDRVAAMKKLGLNSGARNYQRVIKDDWAARMEVYAAQVTLADEGIGQVIRQLKRSGQFDNTLVLIMSDNGASAGEISSRGLHQEDRVVGTRGSYLSYGKDWATVSNAPFAEHKGTTFEGGIRSPLIVHWPDGLDRKGRDQESVLGVTDLMPTILSLAGAVSPEEVDGEDASAVFEKTWQRQSALYWEHTGWKAVRKGAWKAVQSPRGNSWQLYNLVADPGEENDLADQKVSKVKKLAEDWQRWSEDVGTAGFDMETFRNYYGSGTQAQQR